MVQSTVSTLGRLLLAPFIPGKYLAYYTFLPLRHFLLALYAFLLFVIDLARSLEVGAEEDPMGQYQYSHRVTTNYVGQDVIIYFGSAALVGLFFGAMLYVISQSTFVLLRISPKYDVLDQSQKAPTRSVASYRRDRQRRKLEKAKLQDPFIESPWKTEFESQLGDPVGLGSSKGDLGVGISSQTILEDSDSM